MTCLAPIRFASAASLVISTALFAQVPQATVSTPTQASTLPATSPAAPPPPSTPLTPSQLPPQPAQVTYSNGILSVSADNSSLNQILRQISHNTGMKITGGVADERVFGQYGPANPAQILAELLGGTGSNMILQHREGEANDELILTPRQGGPTPPNPNAAAFDDRPQRQDPRFPQSERTSPVPQPAALPVNSVNEGTSTAPPNNTAQPESPNGVKTPQQIYEQLQRMRQQQQQPQQPTTPPQ